MKLTLRILFRDYYLKEDLKFILDDNNQYVSGTKNELIYRIINKTSLSLYDYLDYLLKDDVKLICEDINTRRSGTKRDCIRRIIMSHTIKHQYRTFIDTNILFDIVFNPTTETIIFSETKGDMKYYTNGIVLQEFLLNLSRNKESDNKQLTQFIEIIGTSIDFIDIDLQNTNIVKEMNRLIEDSSISDNIYSNNLISIINAAQKHMDFFLTNDMALNKLEKQINPPLLIVSLSDFKKFLRGNYLG